MTSGRRLIPDGCEQSASNSRATQIGSALLGFGKPATEVAEHIAAGILFEAARKQGLIDRCATSQLMMISDDDYEAGMKRLLTEQPVLRSNIRLYATTGWT